MYQHLFGNTDILPMYDCIGILGYFIIIGMTFCRKNIDRKSLSLGIVMLRLKEKHKELWDGKPEQHHDDHFYAKKELLVLFLMHILTYTFAGELFGSLIGRRTDYLGYVLGTNIALCIVCYILGLDVLQELDNLVPNFLCIASLLKLGCFCAGCCNGYQWEYGFYNYSTGCLEFPIQLVEGAFYFAIFLILKSVQKQISTGYLTPIFLIIYSLFRFLIQFFRTDREIFSIFHFVSIFGLLIGVINFLLVYKWGEWIRKLFRREL